jgi:glyoxylase-like metal-dependent hydrolase (beta-lactamase superfamily II)
MRREAILLLLAGCREPCPPATGTLEIRQLGLRGPVPGESTLVTFPNGETLLIDVGNDSHDGWIRDRLDGPVDWLLITHDDEDHAGGLDDLADLLAQAERIDALGTWDLGGATLTVFLHGGWLALGDGEVDLCAEVPGMAADPNAMSTAGVLRYGPFTYLFAGDMTGGGKGTPDVEGAVAGYSPEVGRVDLLHLSHHGIRSATSQAWADWLLPDDGSSRNAVVGANSGYLAAPAQEVLDRVGPRLGSGAVWASRTGSLAGESAALQVADGDVIVAVAEGGEQYAVCGEEFVAAE